MPNTILENVPRAAAPNLAPNGQQGQGRTSKPAMELLGLLDTLESTFLEGTRLPFTKRVVVDEERVLAIIDKIRLVAQAGGDFARSVVDIDRRQDLVVAPPEEAPVTDRTLPGKAVQVSDILEQAYELSREIRNGADKYADEVLANLEATSARILRAIRAGRDRLKREP